MIASRRAMRRIVAGPRVRVAALALAVLTCLGFPPSAAGQGTDGSLADPISTAELMEYADRLKLSDQQRTGLESIHDAYKDDFRVLRDGPIAAFLKESRSLGGSMPKRETVEAMFKQLSELKGRIRVLDDRLFDQVQPLLTEDQMAMLPRVRLERERNRYKAQQMMWFMGRNPPDLSEIVRELELPADVMETVDPTLAQYERRLTGKLRKLSDSTNRMYLDMFDRLEEMGFADMTQEDMLANPEKMQEMMQAMQTIWQEVTASAQKLAASIGDLNEAAFRSVRSTVPAPLQRSLRNAYYKKAYPELGGIMAAVEQPWIDTLLKSDALSDEQRAGVQAMMDEFLRSHERIVDRAIKTVQSNRTERNPFEFGSEAWQKFQEEIQEISAEAMQLASKTMESIGEYLGPELLAKASDRGVPGTRAIPGTPQTRHGGTVSDDGVVMGNEPAPQSFDALTPNRITMRDVRQYERRLGLDDGGGDVLEELHREYVARFNDLAALKQLRTAVQNMWKYDAESGVSTPPDEQRIADVYQLRRRAFEQIVKVDDAFLDDVVIALGKEHAPALERLRGQRARQRWMTGQPNYWGGRSSSEGDMDISAFVAEQRLADAERKQIDALLVAYETDLQPAFKERYEASLAMQEAQERWNTLTMQARQDGENAMELSMRYRESLGAPTERLQAARSAISARNREVITAICGQLASKSSRALRRAYHHKAYPAIYGDPMCVENHLSEGLTLEDLTPEQRASLNELSAAYRPEYETMCREMVTIGEQHQINQLSMDTRDWAAYQERTSKLEKLTFDRDELSYRTIARLREVLTPEQITRLGGLPEMKPDGQRSAISW